MSTNAFLEKLSADPHQIEFTDTMAFIEENYHFTETAFNNGLQINEAGKNSGSCKLFSFAQLHNLNEAQTLACFGRYYREEVLNNPDGSDHQNIRQFMINGWQGVEFSGPALIKK